VAAVEEVVLVDREDRPLGTMEKQRAHREGALHRAVSVFVFDDQDRLLLQRRAADKYHSAGEWTNTCCSHPRPGEAPADAALRRLREEMGFECPLHPAFVFTYRAEVGGGLVEHELDHVFVGRWSGDPHPDPSEADDWRWAALDDAAREVEADPSRFTPWFRLLLADAGFRDRLTLALQQTRT
jgi:isopentenyl-diphosphate Delta-isomerase